MYRFEQLEVWDLALRYCDATYSIAGRLPRIERFNLAEQLRRTSTSIPLNLAEGSTSQTRPEQARFVGMAIRSFLESVACCRLIERRGYLPPGELRPLTDVQGLKLFAKLQALRKSLVT